ncbi:MAG: hypothetical protein QF535_22330 [Anaerolineales bacterium]|jgi:hypothetical protein|nr:hypothetical protein [Anaerolineales bacterium]
MAEDKILLAQWASEVVAEWSKSQPYCIIKAELILTSTELADPNEDVTTQCELTLRYMPQKEQVTRARGSRDVNIICNLENGKLVYHEIPILCVANADEVAVILEKQVAEWWSENG